MPEIEDFPGNTYWRTAGLRMRTRLRKQDQFRKKHAPLASYPQLN